MGSSGEILDTRFNLGVRYIPGGVIDRAKLRTTLLYRLKSDLSAGLEYNPLADDLNLLLNWRPIAETANRPAISFGTSSDRIGTPDGTAYYVIASKDLEQLTGAPVSFYVSALYGTFDNEFVFPFGANVRLGKRWTLTPQFDGHASHGLLTYSWKQYSISGMLVRWRHPGVAFNIGF